MLYRELEFYRQKKEFKDIVLEITNIEKILDTIFLYTNFLKKISSVVSVY